MKDVPDNLAMYLVRQNAMLQSRLELILAALVQDAGAPLLSPLPRAKGRFGIPQVNETSMNLALPSSILLRPNNARRRFMLIWAAGLDVKFGPSQLVGSPPSLGIATTGIPANFFMANEETFGELVRSGWYYVFTAGTGAAIMIEELIT